jgi:hypothetical protein
MHEHALEFCYIEHGLGNGRVEREALDQLADRGILYLAGLLWGKGVCKHDAQSVAGDGRFLKIEDHTWMSMLLLLSGSLAFSNSTRWPSFAVAVACARTHNVTYRTGHINVPRLRAPMLLQAMPRAPSVSVCAHPLLLLPMPLLSHLSSS